MTRRELRRENEELRATLELHGHRTIEEWEALPQALRDPLAARAFPPMNRLTPDKIHLYKDYVARIFETQGVQAILKGDLALERETILSRQYRTAICGENAESIRAADLIAKVCKWY
jgi:hypothetical protein